MNDLILLAKALGDPTRVRIVAALRITELCVCELADALELSQSTLSTHLQVIRQSGLVQTRKNGKWIYYGINSDFANLVQSLFTFFGDATRSDKRMKRDAERIQRRLDIREGGCCNRGFDELG